MALTDEQIEELRKLAHGLSLNINKLKEISANLLTDFKIHAILKLRKSLKSKEQRRILK